MKIIHPAIIRFLLILCCFIINAANNAIPEMNVIENIEHTANIENKSVFFTLFSFTKPKYIARKENKSIK